ncbi:MAG: hypothetical protein WDO12_11935 [Pseudomonadota bacterium]
MKAFPGVAPVGVAITLLAACALKPAGDAARPAQSTPAATTPATAIAGQRDPRVPSNYRIVKKGDTVLYCRKEAINGSRTQMNDICLTAAEIQAEEQKASTLQRDLDDSWEKKPVMDNNIGQSNNGLAR